MTCDDVRDLAPAFVLGALSPDDEAAVRSHLAECTAAHAEIDELGGAAQAMALASDPIEPPVELRERIVAAAAATPVASRRTVWPSPRRHPPAVARTCEPAHRRAGRGPTAVWRRTRANSYGISQIRQGVTSILRSSGK